MRIPDDAVPWVVILLAILVLLGFLAWLGFDNWSTLE